MINNTEGNLRRISNFWNHRIQVFVKRKNLKPEDAQEYVCTILKISKKLIDDSEKEDYTLIDKIITTLNEFLRKWENRFPNPEIDKFVTEGTLLLLIFLDCTISESRLQNKLTQHKLTRDKLLPRDASKIQCMIKSNWMSVSGKLDDLSNRGILDSRFEINDIGDTTVWEPSFLLCRFIIGIWEIDNAKINKDALMLLVEDEDPEPRKSKVLVLYGDKSQSAYVEGKYVFPAVQMPKFSATDIWKNNGEKFVNMNTKVTELLEQTQSNNINTSVLEPIMYLPSGTSGSFVIMLVKLLGWNNRNIENFYINHKGRDIEDGPFPYEKVEMVSYERLWELADKEDKVYYRTLFYIACKLANMESTTPERKKEILSRAKDIINKQISSTRGDNTREFDENMFHIMYLNNKGHCNLVNNLEYIFKQL